MRCPAVRCHTPPRPGMPYRRLHLQQFSSALHGAEYFGQLLQLRLFTPLKSLALCIQSDTMRQMNTLHNTEEFDAWLAGLRDLKARAKILVRIGRAERGNFGDV